MRWGLLFVLVCGATLPAQVDRTAERFQVAMGLLQRGLYDDAARQLARFVEEQPGHALAPEAWYRLGTCHQTLQQPAAAIDAFRRALGGAGDLRFRAECRYRLGKTLQEQDRKREALEQFRKLAEETEKDHYLHVPALYAAGECGRDTAGDDKQARVDAVTSFLAAADLEKDEKGTFGMPALYHAGFLLLSLDRHADAVAAFDRAARTYPRHEARAECLYLKGEAAYRGGDYRTAETAYSEAVAAGGDFADDAMLGLAWCKLKSDDTTGALAMFRRLPRTFPQSPLAAKASLEASRILYRSERLDEARRELDGLLAGKDLPVEIRLGALELKGLACLDGKAADEAAQSFEAALRLGPDDATRARLAYDLGEALAERAEWERALAAYLDAEKAAAEPALRGDARYGACLALHRLRRYDESIAKARALLAADGEHRLAVMARFAIAESLFALGKHQEADAVYAEVPAADALARRAAFKRAWCAYLAGDHALAARRFMALADDKDPLAEESLSMAALAWLQKGQLDEALAAADRYRARYARGSNLARTERVAAQVLEKRGDLKGAAQRVARAAAAEQATGVAAEDKLQLAELLFKQGDFKAARQQYREMAGDEGRVGALAQQGLAWCAFELGEDEECAARINAALAHPKGVEERPAMLELLSSLHHRAERWPAAAEAAARFLRDYPKDPRAPELEYALGVAQARAGQLAEARATLTAAAGASTLARRDRAFYELAWVCRRQQDEAAALAAFREVAGRSEDADLAGEANLHLGQAALAGGDRAGGRDLLAKVKGKYEAQALYRIGFSWLDDKDPAKALPYFEAIRAMPDVALRDEGTFLAAESMFQLDRFQEAAERYTALLATAPDHARAQAARLHLGQAQVVLSHPENATSVLEDFLRRGGDASRSDQARAWLWLGRARMARQEHDLAEAAFKHATELSEGQFAAEAQYRLGENRRAKGDLDGAVDAFLKLSILYAHEEWVAPGLLEAGRCYEKLGQPEKARKFLQELVERYPASEAGKEARAHLKRINGD